MIERLSACSYFAAQPTRVAHCNPQSRFATLRRFIELNQSSSSFFKKLITHGALNRIVPRRAPCHEATPTFLKIHRLSCRLTSCICLSLRKSLQYFRQTCAHTTDSTEMCAA